VKRNAAGDLLIIHTLLALTLQLAAMAWPDSFTLLRSSSLLGMVVRAVVMQGGLILLPSLAIIGLEHLPAADVVGRRPEAGSLLLATVIGLPAAVVFQGLNNLFLYFLMQFDLKLPSIAGPSDPSPIWGQPSAYVVLILIIRVLMPAVIEELMFRGVLIASLKENAPEGAVIFWQGLAFMLFHNDPLFLLPDFLAGLLLGLLRLRSRSLLPAMAAHASLNLTLLLFSPLLPRLTAQYLNLPSHSTQSLFYASLIATFLAAVALVPLLALAGRPVFRHETTSPVRARRQIFPGGVRFALAFLLQLVTIGVTYFHTV
jgi:membrane protease YdiL (CAAX protease family)